MGGKKSTENRSQASRWSNFASFLQSQVGVISMRQSEYILDYSTQLRQKQSSCHRIQYFKSKKISVCAAYADTYSGKFEPDYLPLTKQCSLKMTNITSRSLFKPFKRLKLSCQSKFTTGITVVGSFKVLSLIISLSPLTQVFLLNCNNIFIF